jgi:glycosyltransferase involved in cell wall biosynthesis
VNNILLTIAIPYYNGLDKISNILDHIFQQKYSNYEILIIDDCSDVEQSIGLLNLVKTKYNNGILRHLYNPSNIGMDANFEKCIFESHGKYIWFFGQDDYVTKNNLLYCLNLLKIYEPDIVFANYSINRTWNYNSNYVFNSNKKTHFGIGVLEFIKISNKKVPSFLPSLILKKNSWPSSEIISKFHGTHFIQLATFLYNLSINNKWLYIGKPLAIGEIPSTGWQNLLSNRIKYYVGFISCLDKIQQLNLNNSYLLISEQLKISFLQHLFLSIECKLENRNDLLLTLINLKIFPKKNRIVSVIVYYTPKYLVFLIQIPRKLYYFFRKKL